MYASKSLWYCDCKENGCAKHEGGRKGRSWKKKKKPKLADEGVENKRSKAVEEVV